MRRLSPLAVLCAGLCALPATAAARTLVVPTAFPTIQSAVNAAMAGDKIDVKRGTYVEQVAIAKRLDIAGAGSDKTIIKAPATLAAGQDGDTSIVEISGGAQVAMSKLAVSGPGSGTCANGVLGSGIRVLGGAHLDLSAASVAHIHDTPIATSTTRPSPSASTRTPGSSSATSRSGPARRRSVTRRSATTAEKGS